MASLRVGSYNLHGLNNGSAMLNDLLTSVDILAVQEHWLRDNEFAKLLCINDDFEGLLYQQWIMVLFILVALLVALHFCGGKGVFVT